MSQLACLVKQSKDGNKEAFIELIKCTEVSMYRVSQSMLKSNTDCADAIQEAILKAYKSIRTLKEPDYFKTWLIRILINECNRILKYRCKIIPIDEMMEETSPQADIEQQLEIKEALALLEDDLRIVVTLYYYEDLPVKAIAALLKMSEGTVKSRLNRARKKLAFSLKCLQDERSICYES